VHLGVIKKQGMGFGHLLPNWLAYKPPVPRLHRVSRTAQNGSLGSRRLGTRLSAHLIDSQYVELTTTRHAQSLYIHQPWATFSTACQQLWLLGACLTFTKAAVSESRPPTCLSKDGDRHVDLKT
jgi:hypothetical protein